VPLINRENTLGVVYVANRLRTGVFTQRELRLLTAFANQAVLAIDNARMFTRVKTDLQKAKGEVERLRIEINQGQAAKQVADITETEYFRHLANKAKELRQQKSDE
jgi:GAF domain-containing protein